MKISMLLEVFSKCKENTISGRFISPQYLEEFLYKLPDDFEVKTAGISVQNRPIFSVRIGTGKLKILLWSQMHGNESTTTKSLLDFFNFLQSKTYQMEVSELLERCTFLVLPMLNPDGSFLWTRTNANDVDLNRDAQKLSQPESKTLRSIFDTFMPDYCFNLHGQRTIYGFEDTGKPSILSFLAPSASADRDYPLSRKRASYLITHIYRSLQDELAGHIGLYDDGFNRNCVGDTFQEAGVPTVLFEAGHFPDDYARENTRKYVFCSLIYAVEAAIGEFNYSVEDYEAIPKHSKCYCDVHLKLKEGQMPMYFLETKDGDTIRFDPIVLAEDLGTGKFSYREMNTLTSFKI
ncbi:M14 family zinc carboxypeptidase [Dokdonia sp. Hel_I_53]|uniref:M14 family zinc carboxypeptidase n=1 Tax=Dokdonia sp. Hel_I_53 TaxID=1566287 RepID=UPI00119BB945|nr:M14 family zinc carboxypeptidase [Dokdonia sp. Hel_I_53]TVZ51579.1 zinc carboxypeptidase [Dokdonia sp. Hel_I_53]